MQNHKQSPYPGVPNVEELENENGQRCLSPTKEWNDSMEGTHKGNALHALYSIMKLLGVPPQIILTIAAIKFADEKKKIDYENWIKTRSNWSAEDQAGALHVLKTVELKQAQMKDGKLNFDLEEPELEVDPKKKIEDDWNLN